MTAQDPLVDVLRLVDQERPAPDAALPEQVRWLEALTRTAAPVLVDGPAQGALTDLRAALGAVVQWGRGPRTPERLVELELIMRALVARGLIGLHEAIALELRKIAAAGVEADDCLAAADAYEAAAGALRAGTPLHPDALRHMRDLQSRLHARKTP